jgi:hypothetical protein
VSDTELLPKSKLEPVRRLEVFTGAGRRRTWTAEQKAQILAESYESGDELILEAAAGVGCDGEGSANVDGGRGCATADALKEEFDYIERIGRLTTIAENRRNDALNEIERRRALFGETLRRSVQEIEDAEFEVIEAPTKGKNGSQSRPGRMPFSRLVFHHADIDAEALTNRRIGSHPRYRRP